MVARALRLLSALVVVLAFTAHGALAVDGTPTPTPGTGWQFSDVSVTPDSPVVGDVASVRFTIRDASGAPVSGLRVTATLRAPSDARNTQPPDPILSAIGRALTDPGRYEVLVALNQYGRWWIEVDAGSDLQTVQLMRFVDVGATPTIPASTSTDPVFLKGDDYGALYRLDPTTGSLARLTGNDVLQAGNRWWIVQSTLTPLGASSPSYGGTWTLSVSLTDGLTGKVVSTIQPGNIRASVYVGSVDQPAIATAVTLAPDGSRAYVYWARQLGQGWLSWIAEANPATGQITQQRMLQGAIGADGAWARLDVSPDGKRLVIAEQIVRGADATGYRLTTLDAQTLAPLADFRRPSAPDDPLTRCLIAYPGPAGAVAGSAGQRYSLCAATRGAKGLSLVTWDPLRGNVTHQVDLSALTGSSPDYVDGVLSPDGSRFFAVNTLARQAAEIDMTSGTLLRTVNFTTAEQQPPGPSPWDRFLNWLIGEVAPNAAAGILIDPGVSISPDGATLYLVAPTSTHGRSYGDGVWVLDTSSLQVTQHLLSGQTVAGVVVAPNGQLAVVQRDANSASNQVTVIKPDGETIVSLALPDRVAASGSP